MADITFILGGARCGKSTYAETQARKSTLPKIYIATGQAYDAEMASRIAQHQQRRGDGWTTLETPVAIAEMITSPEYKECVILIDCLTLWLSNLMHEGVDVAWHTQDLIVALQQSKAKLILVSNEVGQGIVPDNAMARQFRDYAGILHQCVATVSTNVVWMVAGIPSVIKGSL